MNKTKRLMESFISNAFTEDGKRNNEGNYPTYCVFKTRHDLCNPKERVNP